MVESDGELEAVYRLLGNEQVEPDAILAPHIAATFRRAREVPLCLIIHDTTEFKFNGSSEREGLGMLTGSGQGFFGHFALAVVPGPTRIPLGVCGMDRLTRQVRKPTVRKPHSYYTSQDPERESLRWHRVLQGVEERRSGFECTHVMDREGDMFDLMSLAFDLETRFIIRGHKGRALANELGLVEDVLAQIQPQTSREAQLSSRVPSRRHQTIKQSPTAKKREPYARPFKQRFVARQQRSATSSIGAASVELRRPQTAQSARDSLKINIVYAWEPAPPEGEEPVDWLLFTTEQVDDVSALHAIVDLYQARWLIEEYFQSTENWLRFREASARVVSLVEQRPSRLQRCRLAPTTVARRVSHHARRHCQLGPELIAAEASASSTENAKDDRHCPASPLRCSSPRWSPKKQRRPRLAIAGPGLREAPTSTGRLDCCCGYAPGRCDR
jgi:hypothetical protein